MAMAKQMEAGGNYESLKFNLSFVEEWEKTGHQYFKDVCTLVQFGIPAILRPAIWGDLMKVRIIEIEERKKL